MKDENLEKIFNNIDQNIEKHTRRLQEFLRQPSVASENLGSSDCAELLLTYIEKLGFQNLELVETNRHPVVCGRYDANSKHTLIIHGMYDTGRVPNEDDWLSPPFNAEIVEVDDLGRCIVAPGALRKAPNVTFINALESILAVNETLPVNIVFNVEGEHSLMSPNYPQFYEKYKDKIKDAEAVFWPMESQNKDGDIIAKLGAKGMMGFQLECSSKLWGRGPNQRPLHNADAGIVDNTTWRLMNALVSMTKRDGADITIDGFMDDVLPPTEQELEMVDKLVKNFDEKAQLEEWGLENFVDDLHGKDLLIKHLFSPVLCIGNLHGGSPRPAVYPDTKVNVHVRLVPNLGVDEILKNVRDHLDRRGYNDISIQPQYGVPWVRSKLEDSIARATINTYKEFETNVEIWPTGTKTPPTGVYNLPYMDGGLGYGRRGLNELVVLDNVEKIAGLADSEKYYVSLLYNYAKYSNR